MNGRLNLSGKRFPCNECTELFLLGRLDDLQPHKGCIKNVPALLLVALQSRAVVGGEEGLDIRCGLFDQKAQ